MQTNKIIARVSEALDINDWGRTVLVYLSAQSPRLVSRDELLRQMAAPGPIESVQMSVTDALTQLHADGLVEQVGQQHFQPSLAALRADELLE